MFLLLRLIIFATYTVSVSCVYHVELSTVGCYRYELMKYQYRHTTVETTNISSRVCKNMVTAGSVSDPYSLSPDPDKAKNIKPDPDPEGS